MRPSATVVIPVWNGWELTAGCLASLRPTLGPDDDVVVVDNGSADATAALLAAHPWVTVVSNPSNLGFARACNQGAAVARGELVVFLNNDTVLAPGWLDRLVAAFDDPCVVAAGPRSNFVSGPQMVHGVPYDVADAAGYHAWADGWANAHRGEVEDAHRLVGFCLAVRRTAFEAVAGFDEGFEIGSYEDDDLCCRLAERGGRLVIAHESFVHHIGHRTFDVNGLDWRAIESANGVRFLEKRHATAGAVAAAVDGSSAPALLGACAARLGELFDEVVVYGAAPGTAVPGARVVAGADDVAGATASAWTLWMGPTDEVRGDLGALRAVLATRALGDVVRVPVRELRAAGPAWREGLTHYAPRLTRRGHRPPGRPAPGGPALCEVTVVHADGALRTPSTDAERALEQAATVAGLGWPDFALPYLELAAGDPVVRDSPWWRDVAVGAVLGGAGSAEEVLARVAPGDALLRAMAATRARGPDRALALLAGCGYGPVVAVERWRAHDGRGDAAAARAALAAVGDGPGLLAAVDHGCRDTPLVAARLLEALWELHPGSDAVLAGGSRLRLAAGLQPALEWAHRLRAAGLPAACPLLLSAATPGVAPLERVRAAAVAWAAFGEEVSRQLLARARDELGGADAVAADAFVAAVAPALLAGGRPVDAGRPA
jgi:GT2 family glycosyltransferase